MKLSEAQIQQQMLAHQQAVQTEEAQARVMLQQTLVDCHSIEQAAQLRPEDVTFVDYEELQLELNFLREQLGQMLMTRAKAFRKNKEKQQEAAAAAAADTRAALKGLDDE